MNIKRCLGCWLIDGICLARFLFFRSTPPAVEINSEIERKNSGRMKFPKMKTKNKQEKSLLTRYSEVCWHFYASKQKHWCQKRMGVRNIFVNRLPTSEDYYLRCEVYRKLYTVLFSDCHFYPTFLIATIFNKPIRHLVHVDNSLYVI